MSVTETYEKRYILLSEQFYAHISLKNKITIICKIKIISLSGIRELLSLLLSLKILILGFLEEEVGFFFQPRPS